MGAGGWLEGWKVRRLEGGKVGEVRDGSSARREKGRKLTVCATGEIDG